MRILFIFFALGHLLFGLVWQCSCCLPCKEPVFLPWCLPVCRGLECLLRLVLIAFWSYTPPCNVLKKHQNCLSDDVLTTRYLSLPLAAAISIAAASTPSTVPPSSPHPCLPRRRLHGSHLRPAARRQQQNGAAELAAIGDNGTRGCRGRHGAEVAHLHCPCLSQQHGTNHDVVKILFLVGGCTISGLWHVSRV